MYISKNGLLTCLVMMTMSMGFLTSCDDGEDDDKGGGFVTQTESGDFDGTHLTAVGSNGYYTNFVYNSDGSLRQIESEGDKIIFDYKAGTATFSEGSFSSKARFTTNKKGYITKLSNSGSEEEGNWTVTYQFQYSSSDHLTNVSCNQVYTDLTTKEKEITDITWELTWNGDLLSYVEINGIDSEDSWSANCNFTYTDAADNRYMQYTNAVVDYIDIDSGLEDMMYVGLFGKGPSKYPSKIGEEIDHVDITYDLNSKGLVERENIHYNYSEDDYIVDFLYDNLSKAAISVADNKAGVGRKHHINSRNKISLWRKNK